MKKKDAQLINRGLDGELDREERKEFEKLMVEDPDALELSRAIESIGDQMRMESVHADTPDAYVAWQDIRRDIRQSERAVKEPLATGMRLRWAGAIAAVLVVGVLVLSSMRLLKGTTPELAFGDISGTRVDWVETEIPGATTVIYTDLETDMTVIWMDIAQNGESRDT